ncbi:hypothetical protein [Sedimentitalea todarodis]|uniref:Uncharacterized protein n=1 Tax=Sedimentitalea todarodis TaxID=1631240 RepID=A0ABU3VDN6_9RHOB|nr:hypothetical protein [Sedimentitalea todarodis]MDU9004282.1 hypothetical protein [Sedimentitalea todarodis]
MIEPDLQPGVTVVIRAFDDVPQHCFRVDEVHEDCVTGTATTGPLAGHYGEPSIGLILRVVDPA